MAKIILDAGHGFNTPGKRTPDGIREWSLNNKVCNYIVKHLQGYNVEIIRTDDVTGAVDVSLANRRKKTNSIKPNLFISIHHNALNGKWNDATGVEVYTHTLGSTEDKRLANAIAPKLASYTGLKNRGVKKAFYYVLGCKSSIPAVLVEGGFMDGTNDYGIITSSTGQENYAKAVAEAVVEYLGLKKGQAVQTPSKPQQEANKPVFKPYKAKITASVLNVRDGAGTRYKINTQVRKNEIYTIVAECNGWGKLLSGAGWVSLAYTTRDLSTHIIQKPQATSKYTLGRYKTTANLNVRAGAGTGYRVKKTYVKGTVFDTYEIKGNWAKTPSGWVCLDYAKLVYKY